MVSPRGRWRFGRWWLALAAVAALAPPAAIAGSMTAGVAGASPRVRSHRPPVLSPRFRYVANGALLWTGSRYAVSSPLVSPTTPATLVDDQTGRRMTIGRASCIPLLGSEPLDLPWLMFGCSPSNELSRWQLYSPATGQWLSVSPNPSVMCSGACTWGLLAAGRYWLEFQQATCANGGSNYHSCTAVNVFQNIQTGEVRQDPSDASTLVDLDAPNLTRTVCTPLSAAVGSLSFYGSFALSTVINNQFDEWVYLERCGTHLHRLVAYATGGGVLVAADTHEVVWAQPASARVLTGLTLPGLQRFTIRLPRRLLGSSCKGPQGSGVCGIASFGLTNHRLYIVTVSQREQVWAAPIPLPTKRQHK